MIRGIKSGTLNLQNSYKYGSFESYLINLETWNSSKLELLHRAKLEQWIDIGSVLDMLCSDLLTQKECTEKRIDDGKNSTIRFDKKGKPIIVTPAIETSETNSLTTYLGLFQHRGVNSHRN